MGQNHGLNRPLTHNQVKLLGLRFTPTSIGITGQQLKAAGRHSHPFTSRKPTLGRKLQQIQRALKDDDGKVVRETLKYPSGETYQQVVHINSFKQIWHQPPNYGTK